MDRASQKQDPVTSTLLQGSGELVSVASVVSSAQVSKTTMRASSSLCSILAPRVKNDPSEGCSMILPPDDHSGPLALAQANTTRESVPLQAKLPRDSSPTLRVSQEGRSGGSAPRVPVTPEGLIPTTSTFLQTPRLTLSSRYVFQTCLPFTFATVPGWLGSQDNSFVYWVTKGLCSSLQQRDVDKRQNFCISQDMPCCLFN